MKTTVIQMKILMSKLVTGTQRKKEPFGVQESFPFKSHGFSPLGGPKRQSLLWLRFGLWAKEKSALPVIHLAH